MGRSYLTGGKQKILSTGGHDTVIEGISTGVPQGSVLGPILFSLYLADIEQLVRQHGLSSHQYADDIQIYGYSKPEEIITLVQQTVECFCAIAAWTSSNILHLNSSKTEAIWFSTDSKRHLIPTIPLRLNGADVVPSRTVRNLGAYLDSGLAMNEHTKRVSAGCYATLRVLREAKPFIPHNTFITLVVQFVLSKLYYCNSLLTNVSGRTLHRYQNVLNAAARLISGSMTSEHITPVLKSLHWLKIPYRISYKISSIIYKVISYDAPKYLSSTLAKTTTISGRAPLRSSCHPMFLVPRSHNVRFGDRSFYVSGPRTWNALPVHIRTAPTPELFGAQLKTYLFDECYS